MYGEKMDIRVGVENLAKAGKMKNMTGVSVFQVKLGQKAKLKKLFEHVDAVYIVSSGVAVKDRAKKVIKTAKAVKEAGVEYLLVYSMVAADLPNTTFGRQYSQIESEVSRLGVPYTILRLPTLVDNILGYRTSIKNNSTIYWPVRPDALFTPVAATDASVAAAVILNSPRRHVGKTYTIVSDRVSYDKIAAEFTNELGRPIGYVRIPYENAEAFLQKHGFTKTRAEAIMEMYRLIDAGSPVTNRQNLDDYSEITGQKPTSVRAWIKKHAFLFK
jgi:uncharacterized protein YbjT (DUF2867 family)